MKYSALILTSLGAFALGACVFTQPPSDEGTQASSASSQMETQDVSYTGIIGELGVSIYMQGTHKLTLDDGRFIILESNTLDLNNYLDRKVQVTGDARETVEEGGIILRVATVATVEGRSSARTGTGSSASSESGSSLSSMASSVIPVASSIASSRAASSVAAAVSSSAASVGALDAKAQTMAKANLAAANWTQKYCSSQIGFCVPVHKNWWFTSFGATSSFLAHVEVGPEKLENLGDGPLAINVVAGAITTLGVSDGQVVSRGSDTVGYRAWSNDRHIEIRGPVALAEAIRYMTQNLAASAEQQ